MEGIDNEWVDPDISPPGPGSDSDSDDATASIGQKRKSSRRASSMKKRKRVSAKFEWADAVPSRKSKRLEAQQVNENDVCDETRRYAETLLKMIKPFYSPGDLSKHFKRHHLSKLGGQENLNCRLCNQILDHKMHLKNHAETRSWNCVKRRMSCHLIFACWFEETWMLPDRIWTRLHHLVYTRRT